MFKNKVSIGYNNAGQPFFNYLNKNKYTVHSYYFNPVFTQGRIHNPEAVFKLFKQCDTYNIEANILFNWTSLEQFSDISASQRILDKFLTLKNVNIVSVTVLNQEAINAFKAVNNKLKFHVSVQNTVRTYDELTKKFNVSDIDVINIHRDDVWNINAMRDFKVNGIKVKVIPNEWCLFEKRGDWPQKNLNNKPCDGTNFPFCTSECNTIISHSNAWFELTRNGYPLEVAKYFNDTVDIWKLSTRPDTMFGLKRRCDPWFNNTDQKQFSRLKVDDIPEWWIEIRSKCKHDCLNCMACKKMYDEHATVFRYSGSKYEWYFRTREQTCSVLY